MCTPFFRKISFDVTSMFSKNHLIDILIIIVLNKSQSICIYYYQPIVSAKIYLYYRLAENNLILALISAIIKINTNQPRGRFHELYCKKFGEGRPASLR